MKCGVIYKKQWEQRHEVVIDTEKDIEDVSY